MRVLCPRPLATDTAFEWRSGPIQCRWSLPPERQSGSFAGKRPDFAEKWRESALSGQLLCCVLGCLLMQDEPMSGGSSVSAIGRSGSGHCGLRDVGKGLSHCAHRRVRRQHRVGASFRSVPYSHQLEQRRREECGADNNENHRCIERFADHVCVQVCTMNIMNHPIEQWAALAPALLA